MKFLGKLSLGTLLLTGLYCGAFAANISVSPLIVNFTKADQHIQNIRVFNIGDDKAYVRIATSLVKAPGAKNSTNVDIKNPRELGILVSPKKMVIPVGQSRLVRILLTKPVDNDERIYQIKIFPTVGDIHANSNGVKVLIGYGVRVVVRPNDPQPNILITRNGKQITAINKGNTNAILYDGKQCNAAGNACKDLPSHRLFAGNIWEFTAPYSSPVKFSQNFLGKKSEIASK